MPIYRVTSEFAVSDQLIPADVKFIARAGFKMIICNRPDTEPGATPAAQIEAECEANNLAFIQMPVVFSSMTENDAVNLSKVLQDARKNCKIPVLAYCESGYRSKRLFEMSLAFGSL